MLDPLDEISDIDSHIIDNDSPPTKKLAFFGALFFFLSLLILGLIFLSGCTYPLSRDDFTLKEQPKEPNYAPHKKPIQESHRQKHRH